MQKVSYKQACRWNWPARTCRLVWINGRTGRRSFQAGRIPHLLLIIWRYQQAGIKMINPVMTLRLGNKGMSNYREYEIEIPEVKGYQMNRIIT